MNGGLPATGERMVPEELHSLEDHLLYLRQLFAYHAAARFVAADARVLEVGVGAGYGLSVLAARHRALAGLDVHLPAVLEAARRSGANRALLAAGHGCALPFAGRSFDAVLSFQVIEHLEDDERFVAELARVLRPQGVALVTTPNRALRLAPRQRPWNRFHRREYTADGLRRLLAGYFTRVEILGIDASAEVRRAELERLRRIRRLVRLDPLGLRRLLAPRLGKAFRAGGYRLLGRTAGQGADRSTRHSLADWFLTAAEPETGLDLLAVCSLPAASRGEPGRR